MTDFFAVARGQRAHRDFGSDPVPDEDVLRILEAATRAPSAENSQPWVFVVVRDDERRRALAALTRRLWEGGGRDAALERTPPGVLASVDHLATTDLGGAPVVVVVAGDSTRCRREAMSASIYPAVQNLLLAAGVLGYGTVLTTLATFAAAEVRRIVDLPDELDPSAIVPIGRPAKPLGPSRRDPVAARTHLDGYGRPFSP